MPGIVGLFWILLGVLLIRRGIRSQDAYLRVYRKENEIGLPLIDDKDYLPDFDGAAQKRKILFTKQPEPHIERLRLAVIKDYIIFYLIMILTLPLVFAVASIHIPFSIIR